MSIDSQIARAKARQARLRKLAQQVRPTERQRDVAHQHEQDLAEGHKVSVGEYNGFQYRPIRYDE